MFSMWPSERHRKAQRHQTVKFHKISSGLVWSNHFEDIMVYYSSLCCVVTFHCLRPFHALPFGHNHNQFPLTWGFPRQTVSCGTLNWCPPRLDGVCGGILDQELLNLYKLYCGAQTYQHKQTHVHTFTHSDSICKWSKTPFYKKIVTTERYLMK